MPHYFSSSRTEIFALHERLFSKNTASLVRENYFVEEKQPRGEIAGLEEEDTSLVRAELARAVVVGGREEQLARLFFDRVGDVERLRLS